MAAKKQTPPPKKASTTTAHQTTKVEEPIDPSLFSPDDTSGYYEGIDSGAYAIPFLSILQALSPAVQRGTPGYIVGAQPGQILNTVTKEVTDRVIVSVLRRTHTICRWTPRDDGGGFLGEEEAHVDNLTHFAGIVPDDTGKRIEDGIEYTEHRNFWTCQIHESGKLSPALISMTKSQLQVARNWNTNIDVSSAKVAVVVNGQKAMRPVLHSGIWELSPVLKTKGENNWYIWTVKFLRLHSSPALLAGVRENVLLAKSQTNVARQLEQINEPAPSSGEM